jgi:succinate-semialdehyde dehydrogenase/glutarate-semialdehyde dehydrogenase
MALLKKQVMGPRPGQSYEKYVEGMLSGLKMMRKLRIR